MRGSTTRSSTTRRFPCHGRGDGGTSAARRRRMGRGRRHPAGRGTVSRGVRRATHSIGLICAPARCARNSDASGIRQDRELSRRSHQHVGRGEQVACTRPVHVRATGSGLSARCERERPAGAPGGLGGPDGPVRRGPLRGRTGLQTPERIPLVPDAGERLRRRRRCSRPVRASASIRPAWRSTSARHPVAAH
jgi:hypothetical protein